MIKTVVFCFSFNDTYTLDNIHTYHINKHLAFFPTLGKRLLFGQGYNMLVVFDLEIRYFGIDLYPSTLFIK